MSYLVNNQQHLNDVIFANRNKSYGAYAIRSTYGNTMFKSLFIMMMTFGSLVSLAYYFSYRGESPKEQYLPMILDADTMITVFNITPEAKMEPKEPASAKKTSAAASVDNSIATKIIDSLTIETNTALNVNSNPNTVVVTSSIGSGTDPLASGTDGKGTAASTSVNATPTEMIFVDTQPEFEGGLDALYRFIYKNVKYPSEAIERGKSGTIHVKFVVDEKGKVCNLTTLNRVGYGIDEEALRVVGIIPNFKSPAKVNGQPVKVYYNIPIRFKCN
jgi:periplasmic protein TonB